MESRRAEAAQVGNDRAVAGGMKGRKDAVPGARIVGPAVKQERRPSLWGARELTGDGERARSEMLQLGCAHWQCPLPWHQRGHPRAVSPLRHWRAELGTQYATLHANSIGTGCV